MNAIARLHRSQSSGTRMTGLPSVCICVHPWFHYDSLRDDHGGRGGDAVVADEPARSAEATAAAFRREVAAANRGRADRAAGRTGEFAHLHGRKFPRADSFGDYVVAR